MNSVRSYLLLSLNHARGYVSYAQDGPEGIRSVEKTVHVLSRTATRRARLWNSLALVPRFVSTILDLLQEVCWLLFGCSSCPYVIYCLLGNFAAPVCLVVFDGIRCSLI